MERERLNKLYSLLDNITDIHKWDEIEELKDKVILKYNTEQWDFTINTLHYNYKFLKGDYRFGITKNAILLSEKIENELDILLFPMIKPTRITHWDRSEGYCLWNMYDDKMNAWGSCNKVIDCIKKKNKLIWFDSHGENEIMCQPIVAKT